MHAGGRQISSTFCVARAPCIIIICRQVRARPLARSLARCNQMKMVRSAAQHAGYDSGAQSTCACTGTVDEVHWQKIPLQSAPVQTEPCVEPRISFLWRAPKVPPTVPQRHAPALLFCIEGRNNSCLYVCLQLATYSRKTKLTSDRVVCRGPTAHARTHRRQARTHL